MNRTFANNSVGQLKQARSTLSATRCLPVGLRRMALVLLALTIIAGSARQAAAGGPGMPQKKSRTVVVTPTPGGSDIPIGPDEKIGAVTIVELPGGIQVAVVRIDPMPVKPDFNIITPNQESHPFKNGPTGVPGESVRWVSQPIHHADGSTSYIVTGHITGPGYSGTVKHVYPPGSVAQPDPPQPPGLIVSCPDAFAATPDVEALVLATLGMPDLPEPEVWWVPSGEFWLSHDASPQPEVVQISSVLFESAREPIGGMEPAPPLDPLPSWTEKFDSYLPGSLLQDQGGWKGWGDDPTVAAFVTDEEARSLPNAVDIEGGADTVREFAGIDQGKWAFTTWTYVPGDFESDGGADIPGSFFILMNTYDDAGPWEPQDWSVQMQFDSNDGMLKVYYGNGMNTVDVPYDTDRWVRIQAIIDLDEDWTQVYYDDELVTEYSWTGGILGGGGGALDIAAVDLYANGSTSIYYDNISLKPVLGR